MNELVYFADVHIARTPFNTTWSLKYDQSQQPRCNGLPLPAYHPVQTSFGLMQD